MQARSAERIDGGMPVPLSTSAPPVDDFGPEQVSAAEAGFSPSWESSAEETEVLRTEVESDETASENMPFGGFGGRRGAGRKPPRRLPGPPANRGARPMRGGRPQGSRPAEPSSDEIISSNEETEVLRTEVESDETASENMPFGRLGADNSPGAVAAANSNFPISWESSGSSKVAWLVGLAVAGLIFAAPSGLFNRSRKK
jgi:hypothetical protein